MDHQDIANIKHDCQRQAEMMRTRTELNPLQVLELIEFMENENKQLSLQIVNLTASRVK